MGNPRYVHIFRTQYSGRWAINTWVNAGSKNGPVTFETYEEGLAWLEGPHVTAVNQHMIVPFDGVEATIALLND